MTTKRAWSKANKEGMTDKMTNLITKTLENATFEKAIEEMKSRPLTLTHGDFHAKNLFLTNDGKIIFTDFCEVGLGDPISDLVQYIISDVESSVRKEHEMDVLKAYWDKLIKCGVSQEEFPWDKCVQLYKTGIDRWLWFFPILSCWGYRSQYFHDQIKAFLEDHDPQSEVLTYRGLFAIHDALIPQ